jgi:hypothetical protein
MLQRYIYIVLSFLSLFQEMSMPLTSWRHWDSRLQNTRKLFEEDWYKTIRSGQERSTFKDLIKGCTTHVDYGSYFPGSKLSRFHLHLDLSTVTLYPSRSTPNTWVTPNTCSKSGQISVSRTIPLLLPPSPLPKVIWKDRHTHKLTLRKKWPADHSQSSNLVIQKHTKWGNIRIYKFRLQ